MPPQETPSYQGVDESMHIHSACEDDTECNVSDRPPLTTLEAIDPEARRPSAYKRESFVVQFTQTKGPPQITMIFILVAFAAGSTVGVIPAVMTDRFARLHHGYDGDMDCSGYAVHEKPEACLFGSADAQDSAATERLISNIFTFITSSTIGSLSDEHGRKVILISGIFLATMSPLALLMMQLIPTMNPLWYYGSCALTGLVNWVAVALTTIADVLPPEWRAPGIGLLLSGFYMGFSLAPSISLMMSHLHVSMMSVALLFLGVILAIVVVPETLPPHVARATKRRVHAEAKGKGISWTLLRPIRELSILNRNGFFRLLSLLAFFSGMVTAGDQTLMVYYFEEQLAFTDRDVAVMFGCVGLCGLFAQGFLLKPMCECFGEKMVVAICFVLGSFENIAIGVTHDKFVAWAAVAIGALGAMSFPTISAIKANNVDETEQGRIQGALYSLSALASGVGPVVLRFVEHVAKDTFLGPGAMFIFAGFLYMIVVSFACALPSDKVNSKKKGRTTDLMAPLSQDELVKSWNDSELASLMSDMESSSSYGLIQNDSERSLEQELS